MTRACRIRVKLLPSLAVVAALAGWAALGRAEDAAREFTANTNNPGAAWTYGWKPDRSGAFTLFTNHGTDGVGQSYWNYPTNQAGVYYNGTVNTVNPGGSSAIPPRTLSLLPGSPEAYSVVRWTSGVSGNYTIRARFTARSLNPYAKDVAVIVGSSVVYSAWLEPSVLGNTVSMSAVLPINAGQTVDFAVGPADGDNFADYVGLDATVNLVPPLLGPAGSVFSLAGQRFVPCAWPGKAFESIAFDPIQRRLASKGDLTDLCGGRIGDGPDEAPGLAWDLRTQTYWQVTNDRVVRRWSSAGVLMDTVFTVPLAFSVPGWGLDTLDSVRGVAVDSNFVYFVDAGPDPGQIPSNAWFKFSRTGSPVKSSKTTNLVANLDADPDALVDDIVYVPFSSPFMPGRLLVALEHSGIEVLDTNGDVVDEFRWSQQALTPTRTTLPQGKISALAGLTIDPATGNLYLVSNDDANCQVWTRIADQAATSYVLGMHWADGSKVMPVLQYPNPGCNLPLWRGNPLAPTDGANYFGAAYRDVDHAVYSVDFANGELWRYDGRIGIGGRIGFTGIQSAWGMAYDTERGVLYLSQEQVGGRRIVVVDPVTGAGSPLPRLTPYLFTDIAFNSADHAIYTIAGATPSLIRIDRDTGVATVVGNTVSAIGIDYDAASGKLIAMSNQTGKLYRITPATGAFQELSTQAQNVAWEGLAVVPVPAAGAMVAVSDSEDPAGRASLQAWPNPARGATTIEFRLPSPVVADVRVFDVAGRMVRSLRSGLFAAGAQRLEWDGREAAGGPAPAGIYFVRVDFGAQAMVARVTRIH